MESQLKSFKENVDSLVENKFKSEINRLFKHSKNPKSSHDKQTDESDNPELRITRNTIFSKNEDDEKNDILSFVKQHVHIFPRHIL